MIYLQLFFLMQEVYGGGGEGGKRPSERGHERQKDRETERQRKLMRGYLCILYLT